MNAVEGYRQSRRMDQERAVKAVLAAREAGHEFSAGVAWGLLLSGVVDPAKIVKMVEPSAIAEEALLVLNERLASLNG